MILIDIKNARELATRESLKARMFADLVAEETILRAVEEEIIKLLKTEFQSHGIEADFEVRPATALRE